MKNFLVSFDAYLWQGFLLYLLIGVGLILTVRLGGMQIRYLLYSLKLIFTRQDDKAQGDISQFQSLMTSLAATIGIGSIAGMATALVAGGFGAIFWMWVVSLIGMVTKFSEAILAVKYRTVDHRGQMCGGPMYYLEKGLNWKWLAICFAIFGSLSAFFGGNITQSQSIAEACYNLMGIPKLYTGIILAILTSLVILGGIKNLGRVNALLVPIMSLFYIIGGLIIIVIHGDRIFSVITLIFTEAFSPAAAVGGFLGASVMQAIQMGAVRGISSNEAGLGSSPIAAAAAKTDVPGRQALISMTTVFLSSFIVCTITVFVVGVTGVFGQLSSDGTPLNGASLVIKAFQSTLPGGGLIVTIGIILFGFSTILGWAYYGEKCIEYLLGEKILIYYRLLFISLVAVGSLLNLEIVWALVDIMNGLMALPNLLGILFLIPVITVESKIFFEMVNRERKIC